MRFGACTLSIVVIPSLLKLNMPMRLSVLMFLSVISPFSTVKRAISGL